MAGPILDRPMLDGPILVPLDGSPFGEQALPVAVALAGRTGARLELVQVHERPTDLGTAPMYDTRLDAEQATTGRDHNVRLAERLAQDHAIAARAIDLEGPVVITLHQYAAQAAAGLVVMTTHGRGGLSRAWFGSVADALVRGLTIPVLLIRPGAAPRRTEPRVRCVLIPLDGSAAAEEILGKLAVLGAPGANEYTLLAAVAPISMLAPFPGVVTAGIGAVGGSQWSEILTSLVAAREAELTRVADALRGTGAVVHTDVVMHQQAARAILDYADTHPVDLIALTTHGRGALGRLLIGGTADKVMRGAPVPVLLYRPQRSGTANGVTSAEHGLAALTAAIPPSF